MNRCLGPRKLKNFEKHHGVVLPEEYRLFLLEIGQGPPHEKLGDTARDMSECQKNNYSHLPHIQKEFPFTDTWCWENEDWVYESEEFERELEKKLYGNIYIGNDGCAMYWILVVAGQERGQTTGEAIYPCTPKKSFLAWYEDWLDSNVE